MQQTEEEKNEDLANSLTAVKSREDLEAAKPEENSSSSFGTLTVFFLANLTCLLYAAMQAFIKDLQVNDGLNVVEISLIRSTSVMVAAAIAVRLAKQEFYASVSREQVMPLVTRGFTGTFAFLTITVSVKNVPLSIFQVIMNALPFMVAILAFFWLRERIMAFELFAMICCFGGIAIVAFSRTEEDKAVSDIETEASGLISGYQFGVVMAVMTTLLMSVSAVTTRKLKTLHFTVIQFHYSMISTIVNLILVLIAVRKGTELFNFISEPIIWLKLLGVCSTNFVAQNLMTCMNQSINPATVGLFMYIQVVYNLAIDFTLFDVQLGGMQVLGASICLLFSLATALYKRYHTVDKQALEKVDAQLETAINSQEEGYLREK